MLGRPFLDFARQRLFCPLARIRIVAEVDRPNRNTVFLYPKDCCSAAFGFLRGNIRSEQPDRQGKAMPIKPVDIVLSNGVEVILRPAGPEDEPRFEHIVANMSEESRYLRFF